MGVSIHYRLSLRPKAPDLDDLYARWAVEEARKLALKMKRRKVFDAVGPMRWDYESRKWNREYYDFPQPPVPERPRSSYVIEPLPAEGHLFEIDPGRDCESLWIGLCRYPKTERACGREFRVPRGPAWRLKRFAKTQYASLHGWEHFRRCHVGIVDFLSALRPLGFDVKISDEGNYWPRRSERALREEVGMMNRVIAAAAGAMKDAFGDDGGVESPIFAHPQFERLEAEGVAARPELPEAIARVAEAPE